MEFETREDVLERVMAMDKPKCPHCQVQMELWEVPPVNVGDGLGWGEPFLFMCFNDDCSLYTDGWEHMQETYAHNASYRCFCYPSSGKFEIMPVFSREGGGGQIIDEQILAEQEMLKENIKRGFSILADCYVEKNGPGVLRILLDSTEPMRVRLKAAEMLGDIGTEEAIEPLRNFRVGSEDIQKQLETAVKKIHARLFTRECPFCAEIIKQRAKVCKHCGKDVAGQ